MTTYILNVHVG